MITVISPAKNLNFNDAPITKQFSEPAHLEQSEILIKKLRTFSKKKIKELMDISDKLVDLNKTRYEEWNLPFTENNAKQAILAFNGEVYWGLKAAEFSEDDFNFAQNNLRILSGLHGMLKPLDLIRPYRLEMGSKLSVRRKRNLYEFWKATVTRRMNEDLQDHKTQTLINLASNEYFKVIDQERLIANVITPVFKDNKSGTYKVLFTYAKRMRGVMARYIIQNQLDDPEKIKEYADSEYDYTYREEMSTENEWVFTRG